MILNKSAFSLNAELPKENEMFNRFYNWLRYHDRGASMVEYALLVMLIAIAGFVAVAWFGDSVAESYEDIGSALVGS